MPRRSKSIDDLLAERDQFEQWLARLEENKDLASDTVRAKVRDDYQHRLADVLEELGSHGDSIRDQLAEYREKESDLTGQEGSAREELAEAEVRHAVGEYDDAEWDKLKSMSQERIDTLGTELEEVRGEIERLASVQALINAQPGDEAEATEEPGASDDQGEVVSIADRDEEPESEPGADAAGEPAPGAPRFTPRGAESAAPPKTLKFPSDRSAEAPASTGLDELDFLKSVSEDETAGPSSEAAGRKEVGGVTKEEPAAVSAKTADSTPPQSKTLKCGECGELNRPTEWYCERCGAELATL